MTQAPERIWVNLDDCEDGCCPVEDGLDGDGKFFCAATSTGYIRADLVPQWQPIETAPKDGTWVLVSGGDAYDEFNLFKEKLDRSVSPPVVNYPNDVLVALKRPVVAFWYADQSRWAFAYWDSCWYGEYSDPTHWMPLPAPPSP